MRILVIKLSSLGDLFHALPAVHNLKTALNAEVDWVTQEEYVSLVKCFGPVRKVIPFRRRAFFSTIGPFVKELRSSEYDYIIDFQGLLKSAVVGALARGKKRIGPSFSREGSGLFYSSVAGKRDKSRHAVQENMDIVRHLGLEVLPPEFPVNFPVPVLHEERPRVAILPMSRWRTKTWPVERFTKVARALIEKKNASIYLLGGGGDFETCVRIASALEGRAINLAGRMSLPEIGGVLKEMDLLVANDSGPVHMAAALGTPALVVFGPTDPLRTGPYGDRHCVVSTSLSCQPCLSRNCLQRTIACMEGITADLVVSAAIDMLEGRGKRRVAPRDPASGRQCGEA